MMPELPGLRGAGGFRGFGGGAVDDITPAVPHNMGYIPSFPSFRVLNYGNAGFISSTVGPREDLKWQIFGGFKASGRWGSSGFR